MNIKNSLMAAAVAGVLSLPSIASALTIDGITFEPGSIFETTTLFEGKAGGGPIVSPGDELVGIGRVVEIRQQGTNTLQWSNGQNGRELTIYFHSYLLESVGVVDVPDLFDPTQSVTVGVLRYSGGIIELYSDNTPNFNPTGSQASGIATATDGNLWLSLAGSPVVGGFGATTLGPITLVATQTTDLGGDPLTDPGTNISGIGRLDATGGLAKANFDTNTFGCLGGSVVDPCPDDADKTFTSSGQLPSTPATADGWAFFGTGEVKDVAVIPEPASLALIGAGLLGLGAIRRRKA